MNFTNKVYAACKKIPPGKVTTYREIAHFLGTRAYQAVGSALKNNPYAPFVPCHRVVKSDGSLGGFKGCLKGEPIKEKQELLKKEGVIVVENKVDLTSYLFSFN